MLDRLTLTPERLGKMAAGIRDVAALPDPVGEIIKAWTRPNGLRISKVRVRLALWDHLRVAAKRHQRRRGALHQDGQRDDPARRLGVYPLEQSNRCCS
jgi:hypothetical protein